MHRWCSNDYLSSYMSYNIFLTQSNIGSFHFLKEMKGIEYSKVNAVISMPIYTKIYSKFLFKFIPNMLHLYLH